MRGISIVKGLSVGLACAGLALAIGAATLASGLPYRDLLIVAGIDALAIGVAAFFLINIFFDERPANLPSANLTPRMRSLDNPEGHELKRMLVRYVAQNKPVTIGFPADDPEAEQFAEQISRFLQDNSFDVTSFGAASPTEQLDLGIGIDDGNHILVGPVASWAGKAALTEPPPPPPAEFDAESAAPARDLQASGLNSA
jgi:hypothetical protein